MVFPYARTKIALTTALEERQGSAMAIYVKRGEQEHTDYLGYSCHKGLGVRNKVNSESRFDLASLTKILVSFPLFLMAKKEKLLGFQDPIQAYFPQFPNSNMPLLYLLQHQTGLPATANFFLQKKNPDFGKDFVLEQICKMGSSSGEALPLYSDLNFLLVGFLLEKLYEKPLYQIFMEKIQKKLSLQHTNFIVEESAKNPEKNSTSYVATSRCEIRQKVLQGEVDDTNCWALGGYAGHAGLFSTLPETTLLFQHTIELAQQYKECIFPHEGSTSPFTTGFMLYPGITTPIDDSWRNAMGHTGFVGTSAWYHPNKKYSVILLSNSRVHPDRFEDKRWIKNRLHVHSCLWKELQTFP